jgi:SAM-dependent methyltransferase
MTVTNGPLSTILARPHDRVILDLGCGDARATARLAVREPGALVIGVDANLDAAERVARRARRAPEKGGLANLALVLAPADRLPAELDERVDEMRIDLPWGSLLTDLLRGDQAILAGITRALAPGGRVSIVVNARSLPDERTPETAATDLARALGSAGLSEVHVEVTGVRPETGWAKRLASGRNLSVVIAEARRGERA